MKTYLDALKDIKSFFETKESWFFTKANVINTINDMRSNYENLPPKTTYEAYIDGASKGNPGPASIGVVLQHHDTRWEFSEQIGVTTNNAAEYTALIRALEEAKKKGALRLNIKSDSELLVKQMTGEYGIKNEKLRELANQVKVLAKTIKFSIKYIPREENERADYLSNKAFNESIASN